MILFAVLIQCTVVSASSEWYSNYNHASNLAERTGRPLLTLFVHDGCPECIRMDAAISQPAAEKALENAVKVRLEFMECGELLRQLGVQFTPTMIISSKPHGGELYRQIGALSVQDIQALKPAIDGLVVAGKSQEAKPADSTKESDKSNTVKAESSNKAVAEKAVEPKKSSRTRTAAVKKTPVSQSQQVSPVTQQTESRYTGQRYQIYYPQGYAPAGYQQR